MTRMNVLVYTGTGTTVESVRHTIYTLRRLLSPHFAVNPITAQTLLTEPWSPTCALLVLPGGADLGYCRALNGDGNRLISQYVWGGGAYLGFCAGGYYGCGRVEFEVGDKELEVVGPRELRFFKGVCRGAAFGGFEYGSERGARAPEVSVEKGVLEGALEGALEGFRCYYNGGGLFVDADKVEGVQVLARYGEKLNVDGGDAAVVYCSVGKGGAVLTGPHPEFAGVNLDRNVGPEGYTGLVDALLEDDAKRVAFLKACLVKLGLNISEDSKEVPALSDIHLSSIYPANVSYLVERLKDITTTTEDGARKIIGENDTFTVSEYKEDKLSLTSLSNALPANSNAKTPTADTGIIDHNALEKHIKTHPHRPPPPTETPHFSHKTFYTALTHQRALSSSRPSQFGSFLLYANVITSTNTILDKNFALLQRLPTGLTAAATTQVSGRGRGSNVWITPLGALVWSTVIRHAAHLGATAPVVFIQYLVALAVVEAVKSYDNGNDNDKGYAEMPVRLKWPNDIYAATPATPTEFVKIGGILVNCSYADGQFLLVVGVGLNTTNAAPTTSLNLILATLNTQRAAKGLPPLAGYEQEKLLARILVVFEEMYVRFCEHGFGVFEERYYGCWLHTDQVVRLEMEGGARARVRGITMDFGLLRVDEVDEEDRLTGKVWTLQSDGNSFDFFRGLLKKKT
ncbi:class II aaRS and biotin synthetase [Morchella conica CCBAS932]|uniref:Class II aaRS and biotin synthetase n=1 Tax=Morchella conica CCBAS932 TaxID=1392247 RepID=A0A3N4L4G9_9PEZI|nr:class II aaRS and biotin synthetase [Morchella conica CCBAS932]